MRCNYRLFWRLLAISYWLLAISSVSYGKLVEEVLKDGIGVRPRGMGGAFTSIADDANATFYNPAGLGSIGFSYLKGWPDFKQQFSRLEEYQVFTLGSFGYGTWVKENLSGQRAEVNAFAYGIREKDLAWGVSYKTVRGALGANLSEGYSVDLGLLYYLDPGLTLGLLVQDMLESIEVPTSIRVGTGLRSVGFNLAIEAEIRNIRSTAGPYTTVHYGAEAQVSESLILRGGWERGRYTFGATAGFPKFTLDYAVAVPLNPQDGDAVQSLGIRIGALD